MNSEGGIVRRLADLSGEVKRAKFEAEAEPTGISGWEVEEEISERVVRTNESGKRVEISRIEARKEISSVGRPRIPLNRTNTARRSLPIRVNSCASLCASALLPTPKRCPAQPFPRSSIVFIPLHRPKRKHPSLDLSTSLLVCDRLKPSAKVCTLTMPSLLPGRQVRAKPCSLDFRIGKLASIYRC